jgi:4-alpha-glucanotransferase
VTLPASTTLFEQRRSGVLLHPTSLPGRYGCGDMGASARHFVDWLATAAQTIWQVLPLNPAGPGNSPYQSVSTFAGNPLLVDLEQVAERGWLPTIADADFETRRTDYTRVAPWRMAKLREAWQGFNALAHNNDRQSFDAFCREEGAWLDDYAAFMTLDERYRRPWNQWPAAFAGRDPGALQSLRIEAAAEIGFWSFVQWQFASQWTALCTYAHDRGVHLVGDAPIFVAHHSADVWANRAQFLLDRDGEPTVVAGVPPDYFSVTGQRWGNPLYDWPAMEADDYAWWKRRMAHLMRAFDGVRLDHFRGFEAYWEVPATEQYAVNGKWVTGPGRQFFDALQGELGPVAIIAEDLGLITPAVTALREACGFPGMRVLQFAFGDTAANPYLPHNYVTHTVAYTGTHDNDTTQGWWRQLGEKQRSAVRHYLGPEADQAIHWSAIRALSQSVANTVIYPFQDVLGLDGSHRMNVPGCREGCWEWRFDWSQVSDAPAAELSAITRVAGRCPPPPG